jgi:hypothetical protein
MHLWLAGLARRAVKQTVNTEQFKPSKGMLPNKSLWENPGQADGR